MRILLCFSLNRDKNEDGNEASCKTLYEYVLRKIMRKDFLSKMSLMNAGPYDAKDSSKN